MNKAIVVTAIGPQYAALYRHVSPAFNHYATRYGWDIEVLSALPDGFEHRYSRYGWHMRELCCALRLYQPMMFSDYDLLALIDPDIVINPNAPCLSSYFYDIPEGGIAAVQDVDFNDRPLFSGWNEYHYDDFLKHDEVLSLPFPERHINAGMILLRPSEVKNELLALAGIDSVISDEDRINLHFTQKDRVLFLPPEWNVIYAYELLRKRHREGRLPRTRTMRRAVYHLDMLVGRTHVVNAMLRDSYALHFASTYKHIITHLDIGELLVVR